MHDIESEHELEAEYRDFEPGLPRIDLVLGVALSAMLGVGGLFGFGHLPGVVNAIPQQDVVVAEPAENIAPVGDFVVTGGQDASLCQVEVESTFVLESLDDARVLRVIGCVEQADPVLDAPNWTFTRTDGGPAL